MSFSRVHPVIIGSGTSSAAVTFTSSNTSSPGNLFVAIMEMDGTQASVSLVDTGAGATNNWVVLPLIQTFTAGSPRTQFIAYEKNITGGIVTVTATPNVAGGTCRLQVVEFQNSTSTILIYDGQSNQANGTSIAPNSGNITPTQANAIVVGNLWMQGTTPAMDASYTVANSSNPFVGYKFVSSAGPFAANGTQGSGVFGAQVVDFIGQVAATPTFSPNGGSFSGSVNVTITSTTPGGTIFYTTDGSTPTHASSSISNGGTVSISSSSTLKAIASVSTFDDSAVGSAAFTITGGGSGTSGLLRLLGVN